MRENAILWYQSLIKPSLSPPPYVFTIVWFILYPIIFISFSYTVYLVYKKRIPQNVLMPLFINLAANLLFPYIQFGLRDICLATIDVALVLITLSCFMGKIRTHSKVIFLAQIPYLIWTAIATFLQLSIFWLNM